MTLLTASTKTCVISSKKIITRTCCEVNCQCLSLKQPFAPSCTDCSNCTCHETTRCCVMSSDGSDSIMQCTTQDPTTNNNNAITHQCQPSSKEFIGRNYCIDWSPVETCNKTCGDCISAMITYSYKSHTMAEKTQCLLNDPDCIRYIQDRPVDSSLTCYLLFGTSITFDSVSVIVCYSSLLFVVIIFAIGIMHQVWPSSSSQSMMVFSNSECIPIFRV